MPAEQQPILQPLEQDPSGEEIDPEVVAARDYKFVFSTEEGKRVLGDLASRFGVFETSRPDEVGGDMYRAGFLSGQRSVALFINQFVKADLQELSELVVAAKRRVS